jgi:transposase, IS5 family
LLNKRSNQSGQGVQALLQEVSTRRTSKIGKKWGAKSEKMYRQKEIKEVTTEEFGLKWQGKLAADNRWVMLAQVIPWNEFEEEYAKNFSDNGMGAPAKPLRMALGALIIKEKLGTSDRETVEQIKENPYLQYFVGIEEYSNSEPFDASMLVHFRERLGAEIVDKINRKIVKKQTEEEEAGKKLKNQKKKRTEED